MTSDHICGCFWVPPRFDPFPFWWGFFLPAFEIGLTGSSWRPVHGFLLRLVICCKTTHSPKSKGNYQSVRDITFLVSTVLCEIEVLICLSKFPIHPPKSLLRVDPCSRSLCWISWSPWWACRSVDSHCRLFRGVWAIHTGSIVTQDTSHLMIQMKKHKLKNWRISCWTSWSKRNDPSSQKIRRGQWKHTRTHTPWKWILAWRDEVREWNDDLGCVLCFRPRGNLMKPFHTEDFYMWWCIAFCVIFYSLLCDLYSLYSLLPAICIAHIHCRDEH